MDKSLLIVLIVTLLIGIIAAVIGAFSPHVCLVVLTILFYCIMFG